MESLAPKIKSVHGLSYASRESCDVRTALSRHDVVSAVIQACLNDGQTWTLLASDNVSLRCREQKKEADDFFLSTRLRYNFSWCEIRSTKKQSSFCSTVSLHPSLLLLLLLANC